MKLIPFRRGRCPTCRARLARRSWVEQPLLRHGGYGAARRTVVDVCPTCGWAITRSVSAERPEVA